MGTSIVPDCPPDAFCPDESIKPSVIIDRNKQDHRPTVSAAVKLLCGVRGSTDASIPLNTIAGSLCFILENCDVCPPLAYTAHSVYGHSSNQRWMKNP